MKKEDKEQKILDAAVSIFLAKGFGSTTTAEIASEAQVAEGTIFRYFKTKKDILLKVFDKSAEFFTENVLIRPIEDIFAQIDNKSLREVLIMLFKDRMKIVEKHSDMMVVVFSEIRYHPEIRDFFIKKLTVRVFPMVKGFVVECMNRGLIKKAEPEMIIRMVIGTIALCIIQINVFSSYTNKEKALTTDAEIEQIIDLILGGILEEGAK